MPTLSQSRRLRLMAFTALYLAQGLPWGFISVGYVVFLADQGLGNEAVGSAMALAYLPWSFKILAGPLLDAAPVTRFGRRRPFIIGAELLMGVSLMLLLLLDPVSDLAMVGWVLFLHNCAAAVQDVGVDAMAVDLLLEDERGTANSFMWAGKSAGVAIGGGGGTVLAKWFGYPTLFILLALAMWAIMAIPIVFKERPQEELEATAGKFNLQALVTSFGFVTPWLGALIAVAAPIGYAMVGTVTTRLLRADVGLVEEQIALLSGVVEPTAGIVGALIGGIAADRLGARKIMAAAMVGMAGCMVVFGLSAAMWSSMSFLIVYFLVFNLFMNGFSAASLGYYMSLSNPAIGATQFAAYMAATNFTYSWTSWAGGRIADDHGYTVLFLGAAAIQLATIGLLPLCDPRRAEERYRAMGAVPVAGPIG